MAPSMMDSHIFMALSHFVLFGMSDFSTPDRDKYICTLKFSEGSTWVQLLWICKVYRQPLDFFHPPIRIHHLLHLYSYAWNLTVLENVVRKVSREMKGERKLANRHLGPVPNFLLNNFRILCECDWNMSVRKQEGMFLASIIPTHPSWCQWCLCGVGETDEK